MRSNQVRDKIKKGEASIGCFLGLGSPTVAELMARAGFEWLVIETEHNGLDSAEIQNMLMALNGSSTIPLVRIPSLNSDYIQRALDLGALGIVVPMIRTADDVRQFIRATRFPPEGTRSFGPLRASNYMFDANDYFCHANSNILTMAILGTKEAVQKLVEQFLEVRQVRGLAGHTEAVTFSHPDGIPMDPARFRSSPGETGSMRLTMEFNSTFCRGMLKTRYGEMDKSDEPRTVSAQCVGGCGIRPS